jgi:AraC-like DNA-binding protein
LKDRIVKTLLDQLPEVRSMGLMIFDPIWAMKTHTSKNIELLHVVAGSFDLVTEKGRFSAGPGDTLLIPSNTPHRDEFDLSLGLHIYMVHLSWKGEAELARHLNARFWRSIPATTKSEIGKIIEHLQGDIRGDSEVDRLVIRTRVLEILLLLLRTALRQKDRKRSLLTEDFGKRHRRQLMLRAKAYLEHNYNKPVSLQEIARALRVSPFYLCHVFSEESDFSLFSYLTVLRMQKAKALLAAGGMNVAEVALAVGYENSNYFSKVFKRRLGVSPRHFIAASLLSGRKNRKK